MRFGFSPFFLAVDVRLRRAALVKGLRAVFFRVVAFFAAGLRAADFLAASRIHGDGP